MCGVAFTQDKSRSDTNTSDMRPCLSVCLQGTSGHAGVDCSSMLLQHSSPSEANVVLALLAQGNAFNAFNAKLSYFKMN